MIDKCDTLFKSKVAYGQVKNSATKKILSQPCWTSFNKQARKFRPDFVLEVGSPVQFSMKTKQDGHEGEDTFSQPILD